ncbi:helix-turn-helix domain-containing protein [Cellulosimicrobium cellulans]|uniref:helix-turn-helix transcriptional regulator n=1 Tax=Cellulosimicrobium cellulans TaxID=1710 RepID=UPI00214A7DDE|nr:helix-turn-helix domain-containing protein [Cellulosimicrobium cellulans]
MSTPLRWFRARTTTALGEAVRRARETTGLTQGELAERASSSRPTVSRLERGAPVASSTLLDVAAACGYELVLVPRGARLVVERTRDGES